jgi:PPOX class probable F420-dependent enzyme
MPVPEVVRRFLAEEPRFGVLATINPDGTPHQTVMWFLLEGDSILMNTAEGRVKARNLRERSRVSLCVEDRYRYVTFYGSISLNDDQERAHADIRRLNVHYEGEQQAAEMFERNFRNQRRISIRMAIDHVDAHGFGDGH